MIAALAVYTVLLLGIAVASRRPSREFDAFFYGNRRLGAGLIFLTVTATWFGAASTIATMEEAFRIGFRAVWLLGVPTGCTVLCFIALNRRIRAVRLVSLPHFLADRYGAATARLASLLIFFYMVLLAASQFVAWGRFTAHSLGGHTQAVLVGAGVVILYSLVGGYLSVVVSDGLQLLLLTLALLYLLGFLSGPPLPLQPGDFAFGETLGPSLLMTLSFTMAWVISPIVWQRIASARSARASRTGLAYSLAAFVLLYTAVILIAIHLRGVPGAGFAARIGRILPAGGAILVFLGIGAAIMSTADSALNLGALTLAHDILPASWRSRRRPGLPQVATLICGILAATIALRFQSIIHVLGLASEVMAEGLFIPGVAALLMKTRSPRGGLLSLCLGGGFAVLTFINAYGLDLPIPAWPHSLPLGLLASMTGFLAGALWDRRARRRGMEP